MGPANAKLLRGALYQDLELLVTPSGFCRSKTHGLLRKATTNFQSIFLLVDAIEGQYPLFEIDLHFRIRLQAVEDLLLPYRALNPAYAQRVPTHTASLGQLLGEQQFKITLAREEQIDSVFDQIEHYVTTLGLPYLEQYQHLTMLDKRYNEFPQPLDVSMKALPIRAPLSLILAKLTDRTDWQAQAHRLYQEFDLVTAASNEQDRAQFVRLVRELFNYSLL